MKKRNVKRSALLDYVKDGCAIYGLRTFPPVERSGSTEAKCNVEGLSVQQTFTDCVFYGEISTSCKCCPSSETSASLRLAPDLLRERNSAMIVTGAQKGQTTTPHLLCTSHVASHLTYLI